MTTFDIDDLADDQILALTEADIDQLVKFKLAVAGVQILPRPVAPVPSVVPVPDFAVYEVGGVTFSDKRAAERVQAAIAKEESRVKEAWDSSYAHRFHVPDDEEVTISTRRVFSKAEFEKQRDVLDANKKEQDAYETLLRAYQQAERNAKPYRDEVMLRVERVRDREREVRFLKDRFDEYVETAAGDRGMAWRFLHKAYVDELSDSRVSEGLEALLDAEETAETKEVRDEIAAKQGIENRVI